MRQRILSHLTYANVMATIAVFLVLSGGTAVALNGSNTVFSDDIVNGEVKDDDIGSNAVRSGKIIDGGVQSVDILDGAVGSPDILDGAVGNNDVRKNAITSGKVQDESLTGTDVLDGSLTGGDIGANSVTGSQIYEQSLGVVPFAQVGIVGGVGRHTGGAYCNPEGPYIDCAITSINLPTSARVLVIGQVGVGLESGELDGHGDCKLVTNTGDVSGTRLDFWLNSHPEVDTAGLTGVTDVLGAGSHDFAVDCEDHTGGVNYGQVGITAVALSPY
jgi:hypothetical protein